MNTEAMMKSCVLIPLCLITLLNHKNTYIYINTYTHTKMCTRAFDLLPKKLLLTT